MTEFRGTYTVLITPFVPGGSAVDTAALKQLVNWQIDEGIHGLIPLGSTGEFLSLSREERRQVIEICISEANGRVPVLIGTGAEVTSDSIELSQEAENMGAQGVMIIPPFYSTPTEDELFEHYRRIGEAISIPIMAYNNPATANIDMTPRILAHLAEIDAVTMVKESTLEVTRVRDIVELCGDRMAVFAGILGYESFWLGAQGWVAVCSNVLPRASADLFTLVADKQDMETALALYRRILPIVRWVGENRYVSATKAALDAIGLPVGDPREPRLPLPEDERRALEKDLRDLGMIGPLKTAFAS
ncbi:MAG: dihydrodipicolinate synthase family protein [Hyphomicrobiales bacterium]|nr:dihydrodipicolinate synthase family protein [Hyphomicrobiales bacterium]MCP4998747.1 dihydrodipicolinate synthase family protein [Hyphomicrobiales bacterium]